MPWLRSGWASEIGQKRRSSRRSESGFVRATLPPDHDDGDDCCAGIKLEHGTPTVISVQAQDPSNPDAALQELTAGNQRFTAGRLTAHEHDLGILK